MELKKSAEHQRPDCDPAAEVNMEMSDQRRGGKAEDAEQLAGLDLGEHPRAEQTADQRANPVERDQK